MKAPKLRGPFRNVRTEPRLFKFKSRHLPEARPEWEERKRRVEEDVFGASQDAPRPIRFRQGVALVLMYLTYRAILWIESQDYGGFLQFMKANG